MTDWFTHAGNKAKFFASSLAIIGILCGWLWYGFVVADTASDAKDKVDELEPKVQTIQETQKALASDVQHIKDDLKATKEDLSEVKDVVTDLKEAQIRAELNDEYQKDQLRRIEQGQKDLIDLIKQGEH